MSSHNHAAALRGPVHWPSWGVLIRIREWGVLFSQALSTPTYPAPESPGPLADFSVDVKGKDGTRSLPSTSQCHPCKDRWPSGSQGTGGASRCEPGEAWPQASWVTVGLEMAATTGFGGFQASISVHSKLVTRQLAIFVWNGLHVPQQKACSEFFSQKEGRKALW